MKKTVNINIGGSLFVIDEDAYKVLRAYLDDVSSRLSGDDAEVLNDLESRIAEIFGESMQGVKVVDVDMVDKAVAMIGSADEFGTPKNSSDASAKNKASSRYSATSSSKKFYRNTSNSIIGGVCSGIADYFDLDLTLVRVVTFVTCLFMGAGFWLYIILWIVTPPRPLASGSDDK